MRIGSKLKLETGHVVVLVAVARKNVLPPTDWLSVGEKPPSPRARRRWDDGSLVRGFDVLVEFDDGQRLLGWIAEGDFRLTFYDINAARKKIGMFGPIVVPASMASTVSPGVVVFRDGEWVN
jgi:hypothetical protein